MNRRQILMAAWASSCYSIGAFGQTAEDPTDFRFNTRPVEGDDELWYLISSIDALIFFMSVADEPKFIAASRRAFSPYGAQLGEPKAVEIFNEELRSGGYERVKDGWRQITVATLNASKVLAEAGGTERLNKRLVGGFARASALLLARSAKNKSWWCDCYALRKIGC